MRLIACAAALLAASALGGCTQNLLFIEDSHFGIRARFAADTASPYDLDFGYRRSVLAIIPRQQSDRASPTEPLVDVQDTTATVYEDPDELMSMYTAYQANIAFNDPVYVRHIFVSGVAASLLLANEDKLRNVLGALIATKDAASGTETKP